MFSRILVLLGVCCLFITPSILTEDRADTGKALPPGAWWEPPGYEGATAHGPALQPGRSAWPRSYQPALQRDDYWDRVAASRRGQPALRGLPMPDKEPETPTKLPVHNALGFPYDERRGQEKPPTMVTDTVRCSSGFGVLALNAQRGRGKLSVVPSSSNDIHVFGIIPIVTDSTQSVPTYGAWINRELDQLNIQSSDASDTRLVQVSFMVQ